MKSSKERFRGYGIGGIYHQDFTSMSVAPFGGYLFRGEGSGQVFGRLTDPHGEASVIGKMRIKEGQVPTLSLLKMYDQTSQRDPFEEVPIYMRLVENPDSNLWTGHYRIQRTTGGIVECTIARAEDSIPERTNARLGDELFITTARIRNRLAAREQAILRIHPEKGQIIEDVRGFRGDPPRVSF